MLSIIITNDAIPNAGGAVQGNSQIHMIGVPTTMQQGHTISQVQQQQAPHQQSVRMNMVCSLFFFVNMDKFSLTRRVKREGKEEKEIAVDVTSHKSVFFFLY